MFQIFLRLFMLDLSSWYYVESLSAFDELLFNKTYDPTLRPFNGERPLEVSIETTISTLGPIDERDMTFHIGFYNRQRWNDPRLMHNGTVDEIVSNVHPGGKIWIPDVYVVNSRAAKYINQFSRTVIKRNGDVYFSILVTAKCTCFMELASYPMDKQNCHVELESYAFNIKEMHLVWYDQDIVKLPEKRKLSLTGYDVTEITKTEKDISYGEGDFNKFSNVFLHFHVRRTSVYYAYKAFLPSIFLTVFNIGSYFIPDDAMPARVTLIITTFLANMLILQSVSGETIQVSYTTAMQSFLLINLLFLAASIVEYLLLLSLRKRECEKKLDAIEKKKNAKPLKCFDNLSDDKNENEKTRNDIVSKSPSSPNIQQNGNSMNFKQHLQIMEKALLFSQAIPDRVHILDRTCRLLMPFLYLLFCTVYFAYYLTEE